jgi:mono/diheme cytochrome c family protein
MRHLVLGVAIVGALATATGCGGDDEEQGGGGGGQTQQAASGKELFSDTCGGCHTLADAGTNGMVGPDLDELKPDKQTVLTSLRTGPGAMPENLYVGEDAEKVATYVSQAAGQ